MKVPATLLVVSVAANLGMLGWHLSRPADTSGPAAIAGAGTGGAAPATSVAASGSAGAPLSPAAEAALLAKLGSRFLTISPEELLTELRKTSLPEDVVERLVGARLYEPVQLRRNALVLESLKGAPPWKVARITVDRYALLTVAQRREIQDMEAQARNQMVKLTGSEHVDRDGLIAYRYGFLTPDKAVQLDTVVKDYAGLTALEQEGARYLKTPADREREQLLRTELDHDLATLLTPGERETYELVGSPAAQNPYLRTQMAVFQPTEEEYRAIIALRKIVDAQLAADNRPARAPVPGPAGATGGFGFFTTTDISEGEMQALLGEARFADWQEAGTPYRQRLVQLTQTGGVSPETAKAVGDMIARVSSTSWQIASDENLSVDQRKAALANLATSITADVTQALGPQATSYLSTIRIVDYLKEGNGVQMKGTTTYTKKVGETPLAPAAGPAPSTPAPAATR